MMKYKFWELNNSIVENTKKWFFESDFNTIDREVMRLQFESAVEMALESLTAYEWTQYRYWADVFTAYYRLCHPVDNNGNYVELENADDLFMMVAPWDNDDIMWVFLNGFRTLEEAIELCEGGAWFSTVIPVKGSINKAIVEAYLEWCETPEPTNIPQEYINYDAWADDIRNECEVSWTECPTGGIRVHFIVK